MKSTSPMFLSAVVLWICYFQINTIAAEFYTSSQNNRYLIEIRNKYNWFQSDAECKVNNMDLLSIESAEKMQEINDLINTVFKGKEKPLLYIGGNNLADRKQFLWTPTGHKFQYTNWSEFEPNNYEKNERCVHLGLYDDGTWNDIDCDMKFGFICEDNKQVKT
ncbi:lectin subunit alpha-like [Musca vetustissima]|uniref:lectin subunit alpha-like n=1 Tax=Musca vetustissima TaxID=27455 RepID=UPI002AB758BC|nr:lectin subunit alpha-like [Musca vetustissima]